MVAFYGLQLFPICSLFLPFSRRKGGELRCWAVVYLSSFGIFECKSDLDTMQFIIVLRKLLFLFFQMTIGISVIVFTYTSFFIQRSIQVIPRVLQQRWLILFLDSLMDLRIDFHWEILNIASSGHYLFTCQNCKPTRLWKGWKVENKFLVHTEVHTVPYLFS